MDDDVDVLLNEQIKEDLNAAEDEDAPQIVSVIDERPPSLRIDEVSKNKLWLPIGETIDISAASVGVKFEGNIKLEGNKSQSNKLATKHLKKEKKQSECDGGGILLPNEIKKEKDEDISPPRNRTNHLSDSSPPRRIKREKSEDISPPRKSIRSSPLRDRDSNIKKEKSADISPPRRSTRRFPTPDISPPRRKRSAPNSPESTRRKSYRNSDITPPHKSNQNSPLGERPTNIKRAKSADISPPRRPNRRSPTADRDISPPRRRRNSPNSPESTRRKQSRNEDVSPPRRPSHTHQSDHNRSPSRHSNTQKDRDKSGRKKSRWAENDDQTEKLKKTLDGKTAGLQNATDLVAETSQLKQKEDDLFRNMSAEISGANAATVVRKKKKDVDWEEEERKRKKETENKEKYDRWGKGLKQVGDASEKFQNELYEMSKPLARLVEFLLNLGWFNKFFLIGMLMMKTWKGTLRSRKERVTQC